MPRHGKDAEAVIAAMKATERATVAAFSPLGLGAPTESFFANSVSRRESLLRYTNRYFLPDGKAALAPTLANVARILAEKNAAIAELDAAMRPADGRSRPSTPDDKRFGWLRAHLEATRALDGALWRYFYLRELAKRGETDPDVLAEIDVDFDDVRRLCKSGALCTPLGSPASLMRDIRNQAQEVSHSAQQEARYRGARPHGM